MTSRIFAQIKQQPTRIVGCRITANGENLIGQDLLIRPCWTSPEPKPLMELCSLGGGSVRLHNWSRMPAPHNGKRHGRNQTGWVQGSRHQERRKGAASLQVRPMMELGNVEATKRIVGAGLGWSIVPSTAIRGDTDTTILVRRLKPSLKRQLGMVLRQDKVRDPACARR